MRAVIFGYFGTLTDPGAEEYREPLAHRTGELLGGCRPRFWEALAGSSASAPSGSTAGRRARRGRLSHWTVYVPILAVAALLLTWGRDLLALSRSKLVL
jgi:hypothetical protein